MSTNASLVSLPPYQIFIDNIAVLALPISGSELHGIMCGYLCAGAAHQGEMYLRALTAKNNKDAMVRTAALAMFEIYAHSQQQLATMDFEFQLLLPDDHETLQDRAKAFSEWCEGFAQGMALGDADSHQMIDEDSQDALDHIQEFARLDYHALDINEEDEKAFLDVSEYTRMAVLQLCHDIQQANESNGGSTAH